MTTMTKATASERCEFDQMFEDLEAPDYTATCDQCGVEGTNATMEGHECDTEITLTCAQCGAQESIPVTAYENDTETCDWYLQAPGREDVTPEAETWLCGDCDRAGKVSTQPERALGEQIGPITPVRWIARDGDRLALTEANGRAMMFVNVKYLEAPNDDDKAFVLTALNNHAQLVAALAGLMSRFEQTGEAWMSDPAWIAANEVLSRVRG